MPTSSDSPSPTQTPRRRGGARRGAGRKARGDAAASRERILDVATALFATAGFDSTSTSRLAAAAGISEGTLFHYFPNKRALLSAIAERGAAEILAAGFSGIDPDRDPPDIEAIVRRLIAFARENENLYRVFRMGRSSAPREAGFALTKGEERILAATADALARWSARGLLRPMNPRIAAELVFAQFDAVLFHSVLVGDRADDEAYLAELTRSLMGALLDPSGSNGTPPGR